jgi:hypothetical protein
MTLAQAMQTGKPFRRPSWPRNLVRVEGNALREHPRTEPTWWWDWKPNVEDITAEDYEVEP